MTDAPTTTTSPDECGRRSTTSNRSRGCPPAYVGVVPPKTIRRLGALMAEIHRPSGRDLKVLGSAWRYRTLDVDHLSAADAAGFRSGLDESADGPRGHRRRQSGRDQTEWRRRDNLKGRTDRQTETPPSKLGPRHGNPVNIGDISGGALCLLARFLMHYTNQS